LSDVRLFFRRKPETDSRKILLCHRENVCGIGKIDIATVAVGGDILRFATFETL
jgi:hypothetical protein